MNNQSDVLQLLILIRQSLYNRATTRQATHAFIEAEMELFKFKQSESMSNSEYMEKLKGLVEVRLHIENPNSDKPRN